MRIFWSAIALLLIATVAVWAMHARTASEPDTAAPVIDSPKVQASTPLETPVAVPAPSPDAPTQLPAPSLVVHAEPGGFVVEPAPSPPSHTTPPLPPASVESPKPVATDELKPAPATADIKPAPIAAADPNDGADSTDPILQAINEQITGKPATPPAPTQTTLPSSTPSVPAAKIVKQDDGTTLVDDRFVIKGAGTKDNPYRITWEQLVSAQETYQPRLGRKNIPDRVKMLDGKWVRLSGYTAFPIMAQSNDEMLMMLNQWDGCCIGVPPTPYDAVEVKLSKPAKGEERQRVTGTVQGILRVDPYLVKDWLVSLYLMDNADVVEATGTQTVPATRAK